MRLGRDAGRTEIRAAANALLGATAAEVSANVSQRTNGERASSKGAMGQLIETDYFGIPQNSVKGPDFEAAGIELKVTPLTSTGDGVLVRPKWRLKIGSVDYHDILAADRWQEVPALEEKLREVLIIWWLDDGGNRAECPFIWYTFWSPTYEQSRQMQSEFEEIQNRVQEGERLETKMCEFLGTCPNHAGGFDKENPAASAASSLVGSHPTRDYEQVRAWQIKSRGMLDILEGSLDASRVSVNGATGMRKEVLWQSADAKSTDNLEEYRWNNTLDEYTTTES